MVKDKGSCEKEEEKKKYPKLLEIRLRKHHRRNLLKTRKYLSKFGNVTKTRWTYKSKPSTCTLPGIDLSTSADRRWIRTPWLWHKDIKHPYPDNDDNDKNVGDSGGGGGSGGWDRGWESGGGSLVG
ncbi:hypothetical protein V1477_000450, partial [Vespula maculifrons]